MMRYPQLKRFSRVLSVLTFLLTISVSGMAAPSVVEIESRLEAARQKNDVPALGGAIVSSEGIVAFGVTGTRKRGNAVKATRADLWHLGSDTKAMTALLAALFVEDRKLSWESTVGSMFPELVPVLHPQFAKVTLIQLLSHHAGLPANLDEWFKPDWKKGSLVQQRLETLRLGMKKAPIHAPGDMYLYSNTGYVIAAAMMEKVTGRTWEELIQSRVFEPLSMKSSGFGGTGTPGDVDQPWPHLGDGTPMPGNGPETDNPAVMGPAGRVHMNLNDWGLFIADFLRGINGKPALAKQEVYQKLTKIPFGGDYAIGWISCERPWGGGTVLTHAGSNTMNFCVVWMAPARDFAVLVTCNQGGERATKACDEVASELISLHLAPKGK